MIVFLLFFIQITAQTAYTETPEISPNGHWLIESALLREKLIDEQDIHWSSTFRKSVSPNVEIRLFVDFFGDMFNEDFRRGFSSSILGIKYNLKRNERTQYSLLSQYKIANTDPSLSTINKAGYDLQWVGNHLFNHSSLTYNMGVSTLLREDHKLEFIYAFMYSYFVTSSLSLYSEIYGDLSSDDTSGVRWGLGFAYVISQKVQFETNVSNQLINPTNLIFGAGFNILI